MTFWVTHSINVCTVSGWWWYDNKWTLYTCTEHLIRIYLYNEWLCPTFACDPKLDDSFAHMHSIYMYSEAYTSLLCRTLYVLSFKKIKPMCCSSIRTCYVYRWLPRLSLLRRQTLWLVASTFRFLMFWNYRSACCTQDYYRIGHPVIIKGETVNTDRTGHEDWVREPDEWGHSGPFGIWNLLCHQIQVS